MSVPQQGEIWWAEAEDKRRPVLIVTRNEAIHVLSSITIAPVTRTVRNIPTEIALGARHGLSSTCAAAFDNLQPMRRSLLTTRVGRLGVEELEEICRAIRALTDC